MLICIIDNKPCTGKCRFDSDPADNCTIAYEETEESEA